MQLCFPDVHSLTPCYFTVTGPSGLISSDLSQYYSYCSWVITAPLNHSIKLRFTTFELSVDQRTQYRIHVYDGRRTYTDLLGVFSGTRRPFTVQSSGRFMLVTLIKRYAASFVCNFEAVYTSSTAKGEL